MPMLIGHAEGDQVIPLHHATIVFDEYGTSAGAKLRAAVAANGRRGVQKRQVVFAGDHNDERAPRRNLTRHGTFAYGVTV